jgi:hypothetical protein
MIRDTTQANALLSALQTNYVLIEMEGFNYVGIRELFYGSCSCLASSTCSIQSAIYNYTSKARLFQVPGFRTGCYVVESLLQSTLECFYDPRCINKIQSYISSSSPVNVTVLNASLPSVYFTNSTIKILVDNLMIEKWNAPSIFERYYNECQPTNCTYSFEKRNDLIYIATTLFGIAGGLTTVLELVIPRLVKLIRKKKEQQQPTTGKTKSKIIARVKTDD